MLERSLCQVSNDNYCGWRLWCLISCSGLPLCWRPLITAWFVISRSSVNDVNIGYLLYCTYFLFTLVIDFKIRNGNILLCRTVKRANRKLMMKVFLVINEFKPNTSGLLVLWLDSKISFFYMFCGFFSLTAFTMEIYQPISI